MSAILAIDGGGTRTRAGLYDEAGNLLAECEGDATNLSTWAVTQVVQRIADLARTLVASNSRKISTVVAGISGAGRTGKAQAVATGLAKSFGTDDVCVCSDAHMLSWANLDAEHPILVIAGTGSSVITRRPDGSRVVTGGWGPKLGDDGGAYRLALEGIRNADEDQGLRKALLDAKYYQTLPEFHEWVNHASPSEIADLASLVTREAERGNQGALTAIQDQAEKLAKLARHGLERAGLEWDTVKNPSVLVTGGLMEAPLFRNAFMETMSKGRHGVRVEQPRLLSHRAAFELVRLPKDASFAGRPNPTIDLYSKFGEGYRIDEMVSEQFAFWLSLHDTEVAIEVNNMANVIAPAIDSATDCLRAGGRIIYAGAGTSGRLGVLDASECPPTFGVAEDRVIGLIAGGDAALRHSIEGAEDDTEAAVRDIDAITPRVGPKDLVIGITASGTTPYALAAVDRGKALGAKTALVCCNPVPLDRADIVIALDTGPEVLPGSTRLKAGTATKMVLNQISTGAMAKAGYVFEGRMVGVRPLNQKLRLRCIRIIAELTKEDEKRAEQRLDETGGSIRLAVLMARRGLALDEARRRLEACRGVLRDALELT
jgi:N-acetylmuramic acid 6-phosphate etherase